MARPLNGIKVLEFVGLAPGPFCGKILSDFGAKVTRIDKSSDNHLDTLRKGKRTLAVNLKTKKGQSLIKALCSNYDVLIDPFRPGVMEKLNIGPDVLMAENSRLIYARLTGFGQNGPLAPRAGHDLNYLAISGVLSFLGRKNENPTAPINLIADFAAGGLLCAFGICLALLERQKSDKGQVIDSSMVDGAAYIASWLLTSQDLPLWGKQRGSNILDTGSFFYDTYKTKDGKFVSVAALEPQFYENFVQGLGLPDLLQYEDNIKGKNLVSKKFLEKTQNEWSEIFEKTDACVYPVLELNEAWKHEHNKARAMFKKSKTTLLPNPAPKLSRTPGRINENEENSFDSAIEILKEIGKTEDDIKELCDNGVILINFAKSKL